MGAHGSGRESTEAQASVVEVTQVPSLICIGKDSCRDTLGYDRVPVGPQDP